MKVFCIKVTKQRKLSYPGGPSPQGSFTFFWFWLCYKPDFILTQPSVQTQALRKRALETTWQLTLYALRQLWACFLGPAAGASPEVPCKGWLLGLQPWALQEQPFPPEWACQTKSAANSRFRSVSTVLEPPILSPLFGKNAPPCSQTVGVQSFKERNCIYFLCLYKLPVMLCVCGSLMAVKYRETGAHVPYRPQLPQRRSAILWSSRSPLGTTALLFDTETKAKF